MPQASLVTLSISDSSLALSAGSSGTSNMLGTTGNDALANLSRERLELAPGLLISRNGQEATIPTTHQQEDQKHQ